MDVTSLLAEAARRVTCDKTFRCTGNIGKFGGGGTKLPVKFRSSCRELPPQMAAQTEEQVIKAFRRVLVRTTQSSCLSDSLAGLGWISPRRSRDICERERAKGKRAHHIIRYEFYVECSCGYKGRSRKYACPNCGAEIVFGFGSIFAPVLP